MPFTKKGLLSCLLTILFLGPIQNIRSQTNSETSLYNWYDANVGKENLDINNGTLYLNYYKTANNTNSYLNSDVFEKGAVTYENQIYNGIIVNYDIFKDDLLLKPNGINDRRSVILTPQKVQSFNFAGKSFVNLNYNKIPKDDFIKGFYEEIFVGEKSILYIKHSKEKRETNYDGKIYDDFKVKNEFVLYFKNKFYKINSKKNIVDVFPEFENQINDYFSLNDKIEVSNKTQFIESLLRYINSILK